VFMAASPRGGRELDYEAEETVRGWCSCRRA
jgi:hypothetical protein